MKIFFVLLLVSLALPVFASPIHVALKDTAAVSGDANTFVTIAQIADLTGGVPAERTRMAAVPVGRVPLPGDTRLLTMGDVLLKLRQAGFDPKSAVVLEGAHRVLVTVGNAPAAPAAANAGAAKPLSSAAPPVPVSELAVHRGDSVAILVQDGAMTITTKGVARESGAIGQVIRVHRDGLMTDLSASILDAQTVELEF